MLKDKSILSVLSILLLIAFSNYGFPAVGAQETEPVEMGKHITPVVAEFQQGETFNVTINASIDAEAGIQELIEIYDYLPFPAMQIISVSIEFENIYPDTVSLWFDTYQVSFMGITPLADISITSKVEINYTVLCSTEGSWYLPEAMMSVEWYELGVYIGGSLYSSELIGPLTIVSRSEKRLVDSVDASKEEVLTDLEGIGLSLEDIEAKVLGIEGDVTTISTDLGGIRVGLSDIGARMAGLEGSSAAILISLEEVTVDMEALDSKVTGIEGETTAISTTLGEVRGSVSEVEGNTATLLIDLETVKADLGHDIAEIGRDLRNVITGLVYPLLLATLALATFSLAILIYVIIRLRKLGLKQT